MANAERTLAEQVDDSQPRFIAEALVNFDQVHSAKAKSSVRGSGRGASGITLTQEYT